MTEKKNIIKRIAHSLNDSSLGREERTFNMLLSFGAITLAVGALLTLPATGSEENVLFLLALDAAFILILLFANLFHKIKLAINLTAAVLTFVLLPVNFFQVGGIFSGAPLMHVFSIAYVCLLVEGKRKYFYLAGNFAILAVSCILQYINPEYDLLFTREMLFSDIIVSSIFLFILLPAIIVFQNKIFATENELVLKQKKDIEELNLTQNRFFSRMSHEMRTPVNTIIGLNEIILREDISKETAEDAVRMQSAGRMLLSLVNDILDLSRIDAGKMDIVPASYDTGRMLSEIVNMVWFSAKEKGLDFRLDIDGPIPARLFGDETRIKQVLVNILNNAVKYTPEGSVTFSVRFEKNEGDESAVNAIYSISDTGIGIKEENIPHLFNVFQRVDLKKTRFIEGTGLGLAIVKQLVDLMGGTIEVKSVYTEGSTFIVSLPQKKDGNEKIEGDSIGTGQDISLMRRETARFTVPDARILIVDDNKANLLVTEKLLSETQAKIDAVPSAMECLKKTRQDRYDIIFMDLIMPEMDGIECLHEIRRQREGQNTDTPIVALTANASSGVQRLYRSEGFDGYILKPVSGRQLEDELLRHLPRELIKAFSKDEINEVLESPLNTRKHKLPIMIATDFSADIPQALAIKNDIATLPSTVITREGEFLDVIEIEQEGIIRYIQEGGGKVASSEHTPEEYSAFFADCLAKAQHVLYIPISANIVEHFGVASEAAKSLSNISIFDSWHLSSGLGLMALKAAELAKQGLTAEKIIEELIPLRTRIQTTFIVNDTKYLLDAGRISKVVCKICDALMLHPVVSLRKGHMTVGTIKVGTESVFWKKYINWALQKPETIDTSIAFVTYAGMKSQNLHEIEREIRSKVNFGHIYFQKASASISVNCGPGTFGVLFMRKAGGGGDH